MTTLVETTTTQAKTTTTSVETSTTLVQKTTTLTKTTRDPGNYDNFNRNNYNFSKTTTPA